MSIYFITGIDTDVGKTYATAFLSQHFAKTHRVITQKIVQTGNTHDISDDILSHRTLTQTPLTVFDTDGTTCPYLFKKPASPHLAAKLENTIINPDTITQASIRLATHYDVVILEGAGGVFVPLTEQLLTLDYIAQCGYPTILVTCAKLGSINHTLLTLSAITQRGLKLDSVIFNHHFDTDSDISQSTHHYLKKHITTHHPNTKWLDMWTL